MSQWLSHEMAQGLAFNAGSNFDPPREVKGYYVQPDISLGIGRIPLNKQTFPNVETPALQDTGAPNLFPSSTLFPNLAMHLRIGLPWRGDAYVRFADATTPSTYKITPTLTAKVQTNSYGAGIRQHVDIDGWATLTLGGHYNHVRGSTKLKGPFGVDAPGFHADDEFRGEIKWSVNSFGVDAILSKSFGHWTPFFGMGYNYATGTVLAKLELISSTFLVPDITGSASNRPEKNQGREIFGLSYERPTWSAFMNGELKAIGQLQYRSFIVQFGAALPFDIGRGPAIFYRRRVPEPAPEPVSQPAPAPAKPPAMPDPVEAAPRPRPRKKPAPQNAESSDFFFLR